MTYGNLINRIMERTVSPTPKRGEGATVCAYSDRYAGTITRILGSVGSRPVVEVQEDFYDRTDGNGMADSQTYTYTPNKSGRVWLFRQNQLGLWGEVRFNRDTRRWNQVSGGLRVIFGRRDKRHDFSF